MVFTAEYSIAGLHLRSQKPSSVIITMLTFSLKVI